MREEFMSVDEYLLLPGDPAWKVEYYDGKAVWTPRHSLVTLTISVEPREVGTAGVIRPLEYRDRAEVAGAYVEAFVGTIDFCGYDAEMIAQSAERDIGAAYTEDPSIRAACFVAVDGEELVGAALLTQFATGPHLNALFVRAGRRRRGLATALVASAINVLHAHGETTLSSFHHIGNLVSADWHRGFGFVETPDVMNARLRWRAHEQNLARDDHFHDLSESDRAELARRIAVAKAEVDRLTEIEGRDFEAVHPILRYRRAKRNSSR